MEGVSMFYFVFVAVSIYAALTFCFVVSSFREKEIRASILGLLVSVAMAAALMAYAWAQGAGLLSNPVAQAVQIVFGVLIALFTVLMFVPLGRNPKASEGTKGMIEGQPERFNQKDTAFSIAHVGGYGAEAARNRWALQSRDPFGGIYWTLCMVLRGYVDGKVNSSKKKNFSPLEMTKEIKRTARYLGADLVGITTVKDDFTYSESFSYEESRLGVGPAVTTPVNLKHKWLIVLAQEMDYAAVKAALAGSRGNGWGAQGEVGKSYNAVAQIACALAAYIRQLGYSARAHHLRNDLLMHVPAAVDAGLGEQGRHNYLITAKYGPRVRTSLVSTELELIEDKPVDIGVQDFCDYCRLCEENCPPKALGSERTVVRGYRRWPQDQEKCFKFWVSGANTWACTVCMNICPWNKPRSFVHRVSSLAASRSVVARRILYWMAVIFYGKKIHFKKVPIPEEVLMPPETQAWNSSCGCN
jgi:reductive dehalogenase